VPTPDGGETAATSGHYVVCGSDSTTIRIVQELRNVGAPVTVIVPDSDADRAHEMAECGARLVVAPRLNENALREAGVPTAQAIAFVMPDDLGNVHAALTAEELNPDIRMVVHVVNPRLGEFLDGLLAHCTVLSAASMAAPEFVTAALEESEVQSITFPGGPSLPGRPSCSPIRRSPALRAPVRAGRSSSCLTAAPTSCSRNEYDASHVGCIPGSTTSSPTCNESSTLGSAWWAWCSWPSRWSARR
jgi:hypothetical protein